MTLRLRGAGVGVLVAAAAWLAAGCGGGAAEFPPAGPSPAGGNGQLNYAIPSAGGTLDPLDARRVAEQTVTRQIFEPLVANLNGPYGRRHGMAGIAVAIHRSRDSRVWSLRLRPGVRFQDGRLLDAGAVLTNIQRWRRSPVGRDLLPGLIGADGPRPDLVRFIFAQPVPGAEARLGDPRLGLVSPNALSSPSGGWTLLRVAGAGSGPFRLTSRPGGTVLLRRNHAWWGTRYGLGPALDEVSFRRVPGVKARIGLLRAGSVEVAGDIGPAAVRLRADPLLSAIAVTSGYSIGVERSVRGLTGSPTQPLSGVWIAGIDRG